MLWNSSKSIKIAALSCAVVVMSACSAWAADGDVLFDIAARREALKSEAFAPARQACLTSGGEKLLTNLPEPIEALKETEGYGSDNRAEGFSWYVMVQGGRALGGDEKAQKELSAVLLTWANAGALLKTEESHDTYYALKRIILPVIVNYAIIAPSMTDDERKVMESWIDSLARRVGKSFGGDVDVNNHRYLADSVQMAWGAFTQDKALYEMGIVRYHAALKDARKDGGLPLETRRGSRAIWYMRHALDSLTVMAEIAKTSGDDLYSVSENGTTIDSIMGYFLDAVASPLFVLPHAAQNHVPGPSADYFTQDMGFLAARPNLRHYMAFAEAYLSSHKDTVSAKRLDGLMHRTGFKERPLIDDYLGGNATCFFWQPEAQKATK